MSTRLRVRYAETDQMGFVYHANYLVWLEVARTDLIRELGFPYGKLERDGVFLTVVDLKCRYRRAARYEDEIDVECNVLETRKVKVRLGYRVLRGGEVLAEAETTLGCIDGEGKPQRIPEPLLDAFEKQPSG